MTDIHPNDYFRMSIPASRVERRRLGQALAGRLDEASIGVDARSAETVLLSLFNLRNIRHEDFEMVAYFEGSRDELAPFECPSPGREIDPGWLFIDPESGERTRPTLDAPLSGEDVARLSRLIRFAHVTRPFEWPDDPRTPTWKAQLVALEQGAPDTPVEGGTQDLWDLMLAVARADRFDEGVFYLHANAMTRLANEIRRRLLGLSR